MINVVYPNSDLTTALINLLQNLKPSDWHKSTALNGCKISTLAISLMNLLELKNAPTDFPIPNPSIDTDESINLLLQKIERVKLKLLNSPSIHPNEKEIPVNYCYCWLLQQYIRQALTNTLLLTSKFYFPFLKHVMGQLPNHYLNVEAENGVRVKVEIVGDAGGIWVIEKTDLAWRFTDSPTENFTTTVYLDQQIAWLLFSNALHVSEIGQFYQIIGNRPLGSPVLSLRVAGFAIE